MQRLFAAILLTLLIASGYVYFSIPTNRTDVPVLYWVTDPAPERQDQVEDGGDQVTADAARGHAAVQYLAVAVGGVEPRQEHFDWCVSGRVGVQRQLRSR